MSSKILIVDDERKICMILTQILRDEGYTIRAVASGEEALRVVDDFDPDLILMDQNMPGMNGIETMVQVRQKNPAAIVIILTAYGSIPLAVEATKKGAYDYIAKPFDNDELLIVINRALEHNRLTEEITRLKKQLQDKYSFKNVVGVCPNMQRVFDQVRKVADTTATVLVQGESGTGKELIVNAIHYNSPRKDRPFVAINCGAVPVNLLESEFFGHEKGSFTDARDRKIGKFEQAQGGTLFLDEIGELPMEAQVKFLRVLDDRKITRIGGRDIISLDVRFIAATNKDLQQQVDSGHFRLDLFYRLNIFTITVPPLRERKKDIPMLVEYFIDKYNQQMNTQVQSISRAGMVALQDYDWPGNVRDLENAIQGAMILCRDDTIRLEDLPLRVRGYPELTEETGLGELGLEDRVRELSKKLEKELIVRALEQCQNSRTSTAELLKISRKTLFNKMKQYGLTG